MRRAIGVSEERGQSEVLGFVLLFGIVAIGSVAILLASGATTDGIESQAEIDRVESAFVELSTDIATAAATSDAGGTTELDIDASEGTIRKVDGGNMTVSIEGKGEVANESLGAIEYTNDDGSVVAYEGGGVWRGTGDRSMPVSGPPITYTDGTLTLPIFNVSGGSASGSGVAVSGVNTTSNHSGLTGGVDESQNIKISVTTAYHNGWAEYFRSMGNTSVETSGTGEYRTIEVIVGISELPQEIEDVNLNSDRASVLSATGGSISTSTAGNSYTSGDVVSPGDVDVGHTIYGDVVSGGDVSVSHSGEVTGRIIAAGSVDIAGDDDAGSVLAGGDVTVGGHVDGGVVSYGDIEIRWDKSYAGDLVAAGSITDNGYCVGDCEVREGVPPGEIGPHPNDELDDLPEHEPIDRAYDQILDQGEGDEVGTLSDDHLEAGQYFAGEISIGGNSDLELDVSDGDIDILVRPGGGVSMTGNGDITVTGTSGNDHVVRVITSGTVSMSGGAVTNSGGEANRFQIFGTTGSSFRFSGGGAYYGSIYAPHDEVSADTDFDASGSLDFYGTFVIGGLDASGTVTFHGDSSAGPTSPTGNWDGHMDNIATDELTVYVHVRTHEIVLD
ncbi:DUF7289 family protein [Saliphagus infecundisoli]|uniref:Polymer-forming cytoskeletal protein n=1 Tax=Saliphagus infecundisoli TaxID=1849069 RepID=A0ABD5QGW0_9EURY|nr:polymer-forming cytoskeletal protein [Saliphagus infecundisoli]